MCVVEISRDLLFCMYSQIFKWEWERESKKESPAFSTLITLWNGSRMLSGERKQFCLLLWFMFHLTPRCLCIFFFFLFLYGSLEGALFVYWWKFIVLFSLKNFSFFILANKKYMRWSNACKIEIMIEFCNFIHLIATIKKFKVLA